MRNPLLTIALISLLALSGCASRGYYSPYGGYGYGGAYRQQNALAGAAIGGVSGALLGGAVTQDVGGALIGGALGAATGGLIGNSLGGGYRQPYYGYQGYAQPYYGRPRPYYRGGYGWGR